MLDQFLGDEGGLLPELSQSTLIDEDEPPKKRKRLTRIEDDVDT